jgi:hypothetical protein
MVIVLFTEKKGITGLKEPTLSGHILQLTPEVKYLGLIPDKGLATEKCDEYGLEGFWTCEGTFGKIWGLKPTVVYWIYTMVTYSFTV